MNKRRISKSSLFALVCTHICLTAVPAEAQWVKVHDSSFGMLMSFVSDGTKAYVGSLWSGAGVAVSTDNGSNWTVANQGMDPRYGIAAIDTCFGMLFAGANDFGVYVSSDSGSSWIARSAGLPTSELNPLCFARAGGTMFLGSSHGVHASVDSGKTWTASNDTMRMGVQSLLVHGRFIFAGGGNYGDLQDPGTHGIYRTSTNGEVWEKKSRGLYPLGFVTALAALGDTLVAGTYGSTVHISTDAGENWRPTTAVMGDVYRLAIVGHTIFAGRASGLYRTTNLGESWKAENDSLFTNVRALGSHNGFLFAAGFGGIFRRPLSEIVLSVSTEKDEPIGEYRLLPNYPNPFNPSTTIRYSLPHNSAVQLSVFNTLGQRVAMLFEGEMEAGNHEVRFDPQGLSSGVYLCKLVAGSEVRTRKLLYLR